MRDQSEVRGPGTEVQGPGSWVRGPGSEVQGPRTGVRGPGSEVAVLSQGLVMCTSLVPLPLVVVVMMYCVVAAC